MLTLPLLARIIYIKFSTKYRCRRTFFYNSQVFKIGLLDLKVQNWFIGSKSSQTCNLGGRMFFSLIAAIIKKSYCWLVLARM